MGRRRKVKIFWLTVDYHPGFARDLTCWTTKIEREGELLQQVDAWPSRTTVTLRATLGEQDVAEIARRVEAVDFAGLADPRRRGPIPLDTSMVRVDVVEGFSVRRFDVWWEWTKERGEHGYLPALDFAPALDLWHTVDRLSPRHLGRSTSVVVDWRLNVQPAAVELSRLRSGGLDLDSALDHMRGRWFTRSAVREAVIEVEGMDAARVSTLFEARKDWMNSNGRSTAHKPLLTDGPGSLAPLGSPDRGRAAKRWADMKPEVVARIAMRLESESGRHGPFTKGAVRIPSWQVRRCGSGPRVPMPAAG